MKNYLNKLNKKLKGLINLASDIARQDNLSVYLVGGFVRDLILGVKNLDLDLVVEGDGIRFAEDFARKLKAGLIRHRIFGTATVTISPDLKVDIASARKEFYPHPASLPVVSKGTLRQDLYRRDFTINAMAMSLENNNYARLIDFFAGIEDLRQKKIRILHDMSFVDDPTRILRAIRFEKRYDFQFEAQTLEALKAAVKEKLLEKVSAQRLRDELILLLKEECPLKQIRRTEKLSGFSFLTPGLTLKRKDISFLSSIENQIHWFKKESGSEIGITSWLIYFMGLVDSLTLNQVETICKRFAFRRNEEKNIIAYKKIDRTFIRKLCAPGIEPFEVFNLLEKFSFELILALKAKYKNRNLRKNIESFIRFYKDRHLYVRGEDLKKLGITPGPEYQRILRQTLEAKVNGKIKTKAQELALIKKIKVLK